MLSARQIAAGESSRKKVKSAKVEKHRDETPEEREARREERRKRREEREIQKAAEATALLGVSRLKTHRDKEKSKEHKEKERDKGKGKQKSSVTFVSESSSTRTLGEATRAKKPKMTVEELISGVQRKRHSDLTEYAKAVSPKREVRPKHHASHSSKVISGLDDSKDSKESSPAPRKYKPEHRHHSHHEHPSMEAAAACGRCVRRQQKRAEKEAAEARSSGRSEHTEIETPRRGRSKERISSSKKDKPRQKPSHAPALTSAPKEPEPAKMVTCITCMDDEVSSKEAAELACGHWFCNECLKRIFTLSLTDPAHMPPKCCTSEHIPLKHVDKLLTYHTKKQWNKKYLEYTTSNRIYCPTTDCGEWIPPKAIRNKVGKCPRCETRVCSLCNAEAHGEGECPKDPELLKFIETAKTNKYQRCYNCRAVVELDKGCNHMTCICTAEFCYICGTKWKNCNCPWFNWEPEDDDAEYVVPVFNEALPLPPEEVDRRERRARRRADQLQDDEELARRLARELHVEAGTETRDDPEDLAAEFYDIPPALDPFTALNTIGVGLRNGIRRLAGDYVDAARGGSPERRLDRRNTEPAVGNNGNGAPRPGPNRAATGINGVHGAPAPPVLMRAPAAGAIPRSNFLNDNQQALVERFIHGLDTESPEAPVLVEDEQEQRPRIPRTRGQHEGPAVSRPPPHRPGLGAMLGWGFVNPLLRSDPVNN